MRERRSSAGAIVAASLARIDATDGAVNAFTDRTERAPARRAAELDARLAAGDAATRALPLLGVPFAVKNLFDVAGLTTLAGSKIERDRPPATADAPLVARLEAAGAVLVGALNMDEYAYGFTTENTHDGPTRNPHDLGARRRRLVGRLGRGGGRRPGAAHARLRHQRLDPRAGVALRRVRPEADLRPAAAHRQLSLRREPRSPRPVRPRPARPRPRLRRAAGARPARPGVHAARAGADRRDASASGIDGLRIAVLGGYFESEAGPEARAAVQKVAAALGTARRVHSCPRSRGRAPPPS